MNVNNKNNFYIFLILSIFAFMVPFISIATVSPVDDFDVSRFLGFNPQKLSPSVPKTSGYYNLTGSTIIIDDEDPNYNWSKTAAENPWCSGSGTFNDPYVVENIYIDGYMNIVDTPGKPRTANCLSIFNSDAYFIVRNCFFTKSGNDSFNSGIYLAYAENGVIYNNTLSYHHQAVFVNRQSHNTTVFYNIIEHNHELYGVARAMLLQFSDNITVVKNLVINCKVGIQIHDCLGTEVRQNLLNSSLYGAPVLYGMDFQSVNDSKITFNVFAGDYSGTNFAVLQEQSSGNIIQNNTITGTIPDNLGTPTPPKASGDYEDLIRLSQSYYNEVKHNIAFVSGYVPPSAEIPSYNVFVVLGAIGVVSVFLMVRTTKRRRKTT